MTASRPYGAFDPIEANGGLERQTAVCFRTVEPPQSAKSAPANADFRLPWLVTSGLAGQPSLIAHLERMDRGFLRVSILPKIAVMIQAVWRNPPNYLPGRPVFPGLRFLRRSSPASSYEPAPMFLRVGVIFSRISSP